MKKYLVALGLALAGLTAYAIDVKISQLPIGTAASSGSADSFPFVAASTNVTKRMTLWDLSNIPTIVSVYAPKASPTFTGTVTAPTFVGALTGNATTASGLSATLGVGSGGTGLTSGTAGGVLSFTGTTTLASSLLGTTGQLLRSAGTSVPTWTAETFPASTTVNQLLYSSSANVVAGLSTSNTGVLVTSAAGVPSIQACTTANRVLRTDGTTMSCSQVAAATDISGLLPAADGGTGLDTSGSTGVPSIAAGTWSTAATLAASKGGTGLSTSASTGVPSISSGTWSVASTLANTLGGTGVSSSASTGIPHVSTGTWTFSAVDLSSADATGTLAAGRFPALTGDVTTSAGALATTLAATSNATLASLDKSTGVAVHGVTTNSSASAGYVGEYIEAHQFTPTSLGATNTAVNCVSISLTAGDWDVSLTADFSANGGTQTNINAGISIVSAGLDQYGYDTAQSPGSATQNTFITIPSIRYSFASTTTVYAVMQAGFTIAATQYRCSLRARRVR